MKPVVSSTEKLLILSMPIAHCEAVMEEARRALASNGCVSDAFQAEMVGSNPTRLLTSDRPNDGENVQTLIDYLLTCIQQGHSIQALVDGLSVRMAKHFGLQGCHVEVWDSQHNRAQLMGGVGNGWLGPYHQPRSISQFWDVYEPLTRGVSLQFSPIDLGEAQAPEPCLTWLGCPIMNRGNFLGVLWVIRSSQGVFDAVELTQLCHIADYIAIALHQTQLEQTIDQQQTDIRQLRKAKDDFLQLISHELFIPLGSIQLSAQTLERIFKDASWRQVPQRSKVLKVLSLLNQECRRQKQFVANLITLMFPEYQKPSEPVLMNLSDWLPSLIRPFEARFEQNSLKLSTQIPQESLLIECDVTQLERMMTELVTNALKYTPAQKTVKIKVKATAQAVVITIINTGVHIPANHHPHIFDKFYRIPELDQRHYGGSGLGLALVKQLVANLDGTIELKSTRQQTTFTVTLPR